MSHIEKLHDKKNFYSRKREKLNMSFFYWSKNDICQQATTNHQQEGERTDLMKSAGTPRYRPLSKSTIDGHRVQCFSEKSIYCI